MPRRAIGLLILLIALLGLPSCQRARASVSVAVAANFAEPAKEIALLFERSSGTRVLLSFGSTGQLLTQILQEAPFEVFLAADQESPRQAVAGGYALADTPFTYAVGRVVLFSRNMDLADGRDVLRRGEFGKLAIANPDTAPYGRAAVETLQALGLYEQVKGKLVQGNNIAQAFQFVDTENAELGFVAQSQVATREKRSIWVVPDPLYSPLRQDAVLLKKGSANPAARQFLEFLKRQETRQVITRFGYGFE